MVLILEPMAEDIEATVWRPGRAVGEPTRQLLDENLLAEFAQYVRHVLFAIALRY